MAKAKRKAGAAKARSKAARPKTTKTKRAVKPKKGAKGKSTLLSAVANAAAWVGAKVRATVKRGKKKKPKVAKAKPAAAVPAAPPTA